MTAGGWIFMLTSWGVIGGLFVYALVRTLTAKTQKTEVRKKDGLKSILRV